MHCKTPYFSAALIACTLALTSPASAATLTDGGDAYMGCTATLAGALAPGDAAKAKTFFEARTDRFHILCLDSPGGSLVEGIQIGDLLQAQGISTAVARGAECFSACAVLFLAGLEWFNDAGPFYPHRQLHAAGRLGFHAPSLVVPEGAFNAEQVSAAYAVAIASLAEVSARKSDWRLSDSLLTTLLKTPPSGMYHVETVYDAALWGISVVGTVYPDDITFLGAADACTKSYAHRRETGLERAAETPIGPEYRHGRDPARIQTDSGPAIRIQGFGDEGGQIPCTVSLPQDLPRPEDLKVAVGEYGDQRTFSLADWNGTDLDRLPPFMFFDNATRLSDIATPRDGQLVRVSLADFTRPEIDTVVGGTCTVWRGAALRDSETCTENRLLTISSDMVRTDLRRFQWPSGAETVISSVDMRPTVNGQPATPIWDWEQPPGIAGSCWLNQGSGNTFCFEPD
ncbi:hypothetical protein [Antarctobacter sp.]|uniref:COG3904 family protein n=1 Tax=Antarctobacter sp. TaxID=1872577 RepID=UPI003A8D69B8